MIYFTPEVIHMAAGLASTAIAGFFFGAAFFEKRLEGGHLQSKQIEHWLAMSRWREESEGKKPVEGKVEGQR